MTLEIRALLWTIAIIAWLTLIILGFVFLPTFMWILCCIIAWGFLILLTYVNVYCYLEDKEKENGYKKTKKVS